MANKTLAEMNETVDIRTWDKYTLRYGYAVGRNGRQNGHRGTSGAKMHLLRTELVIADAAPKAGTYRLGDWFSVKGICQSNGQNTGVVVKGLDTDAITCTRCLKHLERMQG